MSCSRNSKRGSPARCARLRRLPVRKLSSTYHGVAFRQQAVAQMRPDEPGGAGDDNTQYFLPSLF